MAGMVVLVEEADVGQHQQPGEQGTHPLFLHRRATTVVRVGRPQILVVAEVAQVLPVETIAEQLLE